MSVGDDPLALMKAAQRRAASSDEPPGSVRPAVHDDPGQPLDDDPPAEDQEAVSTTSTATARSSALDDVAATGARRRRRRRSRTRNLIEWVVVLVGALLVAMAVKTWALQAFWIPSGSMEPTLQVDDRVLVNKISYDIEDVERGDIIVFERPDGWGVGDIKDLIKRVIALPGETVSVVDGVVHIDGQPLDEPYLADGTLTPDFFAESGCVPSCAVPEDHLFVLGDNRTNSDASNHFGFVPFDDVVGRAFVRVWPPGEIGGL
jgi:signal peptidase I